MALFVHLAPQSCVPHIRRGGIRRLRKLCDGHSGGLFATPVVRNFYLTHQWLRELRRGRSGPLVGIYFRIPDDELVWLGYYNQPHRAMTAAEAHAQFAAAENALGWQVIIPRRIAAAEIHRIRLLPQVIGWRYHPQSKGPWPFCTCKFCTGGEYGSRKLRIRMGTDD